jgi:hypothetical protein
MREFNSFAASLSDRPGDRLRLAVARELATVYADMLHQPLPPELRNLIEALEDRYRSRPFPGSQRDGREGAALRL